MGGKSPKKKRRGLFGEEDELEVVGEPASASGQLALADKDKDKKDKQDKQDKGKGKGTKKLTQEQVGAAMPLVLKAVSHSLLSVRELEAVAYDVVLLIAESPILNLMRVKTKQWTEEAQKRGKNHGLGPPHLSAWEGLLEGLLAPGMEIGAVNRANIVKLAEHTKGLEEGEKMLLVRYCRAKTTYNKETAKLVLALRGEFEQYRAPLLRALEQAGGEAKAGRAPRGGMERALQKFLDEWEGKSR